jgi:hypothetical protein
MDLQARRQGEKMEQQKGRSPEANSPPTKHLKAIPP